MSTTHEEVKADHGAQKKRPLVRVEPQSHRDDGSPIAGEGQVYVTRSGKRHHTMWCGIMAAQWRDYPKTVFLSTLADVGGRELCPQCKYHPESSTSQRPLIKVETTNLREDGSPIAREGQAYVTRSGKLYHTKWCGSMTSKWQDKPGTVFVSALADLGDRGLCPQCQHDTESGSLQRPLIKVETTNLRDDGSPVAGDGQVYVTRTGKLFHTQWCSIMDGQWRAGQKGIYVTMIADVGPRGRCTQCDRDPEVMKRSKFEQAEWRRLNQELDQLGRTIARTLVVKGPEGVNTLGPQVIRFRETEAELSALSGRVGGSFPDSNDAPNS